MWLEEAARFLHHACRGLPARGNNQARANSSRFYAQALECALGYFGSRVLYPARPAGDDDAGRQLHDASDSERKKIDCSAQFARLHAGRRAV